MPMFIQLDVNKFGKIVAWRANSYAGPWEFAAKGNTPSQVLRAIAADAAKEGKTDAK